VISFDCLQRTAQRIRIRFPHSTLYPCATNRFAKISAVETFSTTAYL
jgi:hypothetical protein